MLRRKDRERAREFLAEGPQSVREALGAGAASLLVVDDSAIERHVDLVDRATTAGIAVRIADRDELSGLSDTVQPQGILAICSFLDRPAEEIVDAGGRLLVACADIRDPGNAGTVIRSADAFGADGVLLSAGSVDPYNPKTVRSTAGSLFHLPLAQTVDLAAVTARARGRGVQVLAADGRGAADLTDLQTDGSLANPTLWLLGNEAWGLPDEVAALADRSVRVPLYGRAESLNLASAAAVCLFASATAQRPRAESGRRRAPTFVD